MEETQQTSVQQPMEPVGFPGANRPATTQPKKSWKWLIILVLFLVVIGGVTFFVFKSSKSGSTLGENTETPTDSLISETPVESPTPTPAAVDKAQVRIQVLNGTGIAGEAGILSDQLKNLGYTEVKTGNAASQSETDTTVTFSTTLSQDVITEITEKLNGLYTSVKTNTGSTSADFDVEIITGLRKGQTAQPAATETATPVPTDTPSPSPTG